MPRASPVPFLLLVMVLTALSIRLQHLDQSLLSFHPTRQYRSAVIARACYYDHVEVPDWARRTARANREIQPAGEPPVMEWLSCVAYRTLGREPLAVPRSLAAIFWVGGALPLFGIAATIASPAAALVGTAAYLFAPYGIVASRAFQPDSLMTSASLFAIWALLRASGQPSRRRLIVAGATVAIATLIKPMSVFVTMPAALACAFVAGGGIFGALRAPRLWLPALIGVGGGSIYYVFGALFGTLARDQMQLRFVPSLITTPFFWRGLWTQASHVFGPALFAVTIAGTLVSARGRARSLLVALWLGYAAFAVAFTYHMPTHDYYHLPYLVLAGLASACLAERVISAVRTRFALGLAVLVASAAAVLGAWSAAPRLRAEDREKVAQYERIGELAQHSARVIFLDLQYGYPLMYHGQISGDAWPTSDDLAAESLGGAPAITARARYERDFADYGATHFVVTDVASLAAQRDLQELLQEIGTVVARTATYQVYRLERDR